MRELLPQAEVYIYENADQFGYYLRLLRDMNQTELNEMKGRVLSIIRNASDVALASTLLDVYAEAAGHLKQQLKRKEERSQKEHRRVKAQKRTTAVKKIRHKKAED